MGTLCFHILDASVYQLGLPWASSRCKMDENTVALSGQVKTQKND